MIRAAKDTAAAEDHVRGILRFLGEDPKREGLLETPARVVRAMGEHFSGYAQDPGEYLAKTFEEVDGYDELVLVSDIEVFSHCEHHMVPFVGKAHVAYIPNGRVVGLEQAGARGRRVRQAPAGARKAHQADRRRDQIHSSRKAWR